MIIIDVQLIPVVPGAAADAVVVGRLAPADWTAIGSLGFAADRDRAVTARAAARLQLGRRLGLDPRRVPLIAPEGGGAIEVVGTDVGISWSHSDRWVALAIVSGHRVGVDIEKVPKAVPTRALATIGVGSLEEFVRREAAGKAVGQGLDGPWPSGVRAEPFAAPAGFLGAVAAPGDDWRAQVRIVDELEPPVQASAKAVGAWDNFGSAYRRLGLAVPRLERVSRPRSWLTGDSATASSCRPARAR